VQAGRKVFADKGDMELARVLGNISPPVKGWLGDIKRPMAAVKVKSYRCTDCGFLMNFAT
jgi:hypothetical protein